MPPTFRNVVAVVVGLVAGGIVNMGLVTIGPMIVAPPPGADMSTAEGIAAAMPLLRPAHFVFPFLAHALGTLVGAYVAVRLAVSHGQLLAGVVGGLGLAGGIAAASMIPAPTWFIALDLVVAYLPMAWLGARLARGGSRPA